MEKLKEFFSEKTVSNVLDIGTGTGDFVAILNDVFNESTQIIGVDPGENWLEKARKRFPQKHISFKKMQGEELKFEDNSFDVVSISNALHHLKDISVSIAEINRVLKSGGWIIINEISADELNEAQENQKMLHHFKSFADRKNGITHNDTWSKAGILKIISNQGIDVKLSFPHNSKMKSPTFDEQSLNEKYKMMEDHLETLKGYSEYEEMAKKLPVFKERLFKHGFQLATQLMTVGQFQ